MNVVNQNLNHNPFAAKEGPAKPSAAAAQRPIAAAESGMPAEAASAAAAADGTAETASAAFVETAAPLGEQAGQTVKPGKFQPSSVKDFNNQSMGEEIANAISHGVGAALAIAGTVVMIVCASVYSDAMGVVCGCLYGFSLIFLYLMSTIYHSLTNVKAKAVFQVMDHCTIFVLILGSYIPICLSLLGGALGWTLFGVNAFFTVLGITANAVNVHRWEKLSLALYLLMGWSIIFCVKPVLALIPPAGFWLLLAGGLSYTIGVIFYRLPKPRYMHCVWHLFVLGGSVFHYFFILFYVIIRKGL